LEPSPSKRKLGMINLDISQNRGQHTALDSSQVINSLKKDDNKSLFWKLCPQNTPTYIYLQTFQSHTNRTFSAVARITDTFIMFKDVAPDTSCIAATVLR
jgi:hypothetical protein